MHSKCKLLKMIPMFKSQVLSNKNVNSDNLGLNNSTESP